MNHSTVPTHEIANVSAHVRQCIDTMDINGAIRALSTILSNEQRAAFFIEVASTSTNMGKIVICLSYIGEVS